MTSEQVMDAFKEKGIEVTIYETPFHTVETVVIDTSEHDKQIREEYKDIGIQQSIDSALDFLWGACIEVDQKEMERYIKVMCEKKGYEI